MRLKHEEREKILIPWKTEEERERERERERE